MGNINAIPSLEKLKPVSSESSEIKDIPFVQPTIVQKGNLSYNSDKNSVASTFGEIMTKYWENKLGKPLMFAIVPTYDDYKNFKSNPTFPNDEKNNNKQFIMVKVQDTRVSSIAIHIYYFHANEEWILTDSGRIFVNLQELSDEECAKYGIFHAR